MDTISIMYKIIGIMAKMKLPIVFKGAMVLKHVMKVNGFIATYRLTSDIDMDWVEGKISTDELTNRIVEAVNELGINSLSVVCRRNSDTGRSAGFVVNYESHKLFSFDVNIKTNPFIADYVTDTGIVFTGASIEKMYADKMCAISSKLALRRSKDIYDLYLLSFLKGYKIKNIIEICEYQNKEVGDFAIFANNISVLMHAYGELRNVVNKPDFEEVYGRVRDFCLPFITRDYEFINGSWSPYTEMWHQI